MKRLIAAALIALTAIAPMQPASAQAPNQRTVLGNYGPWELGRLKKSCGLLRKDGDNIVLLVGTIGNNIMISVGAMYPGYKPELDAQGISMTLNGNRIANQVTVAAPKENNTATTLISVLSSYEALPPLPAQVVFSQGETKLFEALLDPSAEAITAWRACVGGKDI